MKKTKILVPAMGMLLLSTAASITGTVAWFAANASVTATGMQITAKTENTYLLISKTNTTAATIQSENVKTVDIAMTEAQSQLFPSAPVLSAGEAAYLTTSGKTVSGATITTAGAQVTNAATAAAVTNWYTAAALGPGSANIDATTAVQLESFTDYVWVQNLYLTVAAGSNGARNLSITATFTQKTGGADLAAVKMIAVTDDGGFATLSSASTSANIQGTNTTITDQIVRTVSLYLYYDGNESVVYTNNMANLKGVDISVKLDVVSAASN